MNDLADSFFKIAIPGSMPQSGNLLVAEPFLDEPYFRHSVISLLEYDAAGGATGVVMNHNTGYILQDLLDNINAEGPIPVYCGGPLGLDRLVYIHTIGDNIIPGARMYADGLYIGGDFDAMTEYVNSGYPVEGYVRFFTGHSGWMEGQLEREIEQGAWVPMSASPDTAALLRLDGDRYWHRAVRTLGSKFRPWQLLPANPLFN